MSDLTERALRALLFDDPRLIAAVRAEVIATVIPDLEREVNERIMLGTHSQPDEVEVMNKPTKGDLPATFRGWILREMILNWGFETFDSTGFNFDGSLKPCPECEDSSKLACRLSKINLRVHCVACNYDGPAFTFDELTPKGGGELNLEPAKKAWNETHDKAAARFKRFQEFEVEVNQKLTELFKKSEIPQPNLEKTHTTP